MKILFLQKRILFPADTGGKIRTLNIIRHLARWHDITYLCNVQDGDAPHLDAMRQLGLTLETIPWSEVSKSSPLFYRDLALNLLSPYPFTVAKDYDARLRAKAVELLAKQSFDLVICDFVQMALNAIGLDAKASLLFEHNVEAEIFRRHAENDHGWLRRKYMAIQWKKMQRFEADAGKKFDAVVAVSEKDKATYEKEYGWTNVYAIDTAVDVDYFRPSENGVNNDRVVFVASMDWLPNQDGAAYFVRDVWPMIRQQRPGATFQIVGRNPPDFIRKLGGSDGVEVVGGVPDVRPYLAGAAVVAVPLLVGGGTRIKIFEAMAAGKAVVSTTLGAEGLPVNSGEHLILADDPATFANSVTELLGGHARRSRMGSAARLLVESRFAAEGVAKQFDGICQAAVARAKSRRSQSTGGGRSHA